MTKIFGPLVALDDVLDQGRGRLVPRAARRERRRQVDARQMHHGLLLGRQGPGAARRHGGADPQSARRARLRHRHGLPAFHAGALADRRGEPRHQPRRCARRHRLEKGESRRSTPSSTACRSACRSTCRSRRSRPARSRSSKSSSCSISTSGLLILDEPTSVLTPDEADEMLGLLRGMAQRKEITVIMITHKFREVTAFCRQRHACCGAAARSAAARSRTCRPTTWRA